MGEGVNKLKELNVRYVSIPLRKIKTNLSLVSSIMNEDKDFWTNTST